MRNIFVEKSYTKCVGETTPKPFSKKSKSSLSLHQQSNLIFQLTHQQEIIYFTLKYSQSISHAIFQFQSNISVLNVNPFHATGFLLYPSPSPKRDNRWFLFIYFLKCPKISDFLMLSEDIERDQLHEVDYVSHYVYPNKLYRQSYLQYDFGNIASYQTLLNFYF